MTFWSNSRIDRIRSGSGRSAKLNSPMNTLNTLSRACWRARAHDPRTFRRAPVSVEIPHRRAKRGIIIAVVRRQSWFVPDVRQVCEFHPQKPFRIETPWRRPFASGQAAAAVRWVKVLPEGNNRAYSSHFRSIWCGPTAVPDGEVTARRACHHSAKAGLLDRCNGWGDLTCLQKAALLLLRPHCCWFREHFLHC